MLDVIRITALVFLCCTFAPLVSAEQRNPNRGNLDQPHHRTVGAVHSKSHVSFIAGTSTVQEHDETAFTVGIDFERELSPHLGVGLVIEHAFGGLDASSLFAVADVHLGRGWVVQMGPGVEFVDDRTLAVARLGVFREMHWGQMVVAPSVSYDLTKAEDTVVVGVAFGHRF